jgi:hypothetical protein
LNLSFEQGDHDVPEQDYHAQFAYWKPFGEPMEGTTINMTEHYFDLGAVTDPNAVEDTGGGESGPNWLLIILVLLALAGVGAFLYLKRNQVMGALGIKKKPEPVSVKEPSASSS